MDTFQLEEAIYDTMDSCELNISEDCVNLLIETACAESCCGKFIKQINGPACGIFQIEPNTAKDVLDNFIKYRPNYKKIYDDLFIKSLSLEQNLMYNLAFQIFICRLIYLRIKEPIPCSKISRASYWKQYYNTNLGKGTVNGYLDKVKKYDTRKYI